MYQKFSFVAFQYNEAKDVEVCLWERNLIIYIWIAKKENSYLFAIAAWAAASLAIGTLNGEHDT